MLHSLIKRKKVLLLTISYDVVITVATYKRPDLLRALLFSLQQQVDVGSTSYHVVVVDNDSEQSARETCLDFKSLVTYATEPAPGIAAARNTGVSIALTFQPDAIVFIDDDETATAEWLRELLTVWRTSDADVVTGPVHYELPEGYERLRAAVPYFTSPSRTNYSVVSDVATNNTLVKTSWFQGVDKLYFDESYSLTGGSDVELFHRLQKRGGTCVWAKAAVVIETVPESRVTDGWIRRRDLRNGQLQARLRIEMDNHSALQILFEGVLKVFKGAALFAVTRTGRNSRYQAWRSFQTGRGYLKAVSGKHFNEYAHGRVKGK